MENRNVIPNSVLAVGNVKKKNYILGFNGLRGISILLVIITHTGVYHYLPDNAYMRENVFYFFSGAAGVNIFFSISGFLITTLLLNEKENYGRINIKYFFIRRFLRLLPPIIPFYLGILVFMYFGFIRETYIGLLLSIFYLFNFVPKAKLFWSTELSHTWSLAVEEQFYLTWPFILKFMRDKLVYFIIGIVLILSILFFYLMPQVIINVKGRSMKIEDLFFIYHWPIPAVSSILIGSFSSILNNRRNKINIAFDRKYIIYIGLFFFASAFYLPNFLFPMVSIFHAIGTAIILLWICHNQEGQIVNVLENKVLSYIGKISYGLYIWQGFFVRSGPDMRPKIWVHDFPVNIIFTFIVAIISYEIYEKKILGIKQKYNASN
jgi:peptidoglycan/LPS O-acetylase OafA/YrhL